MWAVRVGPWVFVKVDTHLRYEGNTSNTICTLPDWARPAIPSYFAAVSSRPGIGDRVAAQIFVSGDGVLTFFSYEDSYFQIGGLSYPAA